MTPLQSRALGRLPLSEATVESFYDGTRSGTAEQCLKALCESHERLRAELEGAEVLYLDVTKDLNAAQADFLRLNARVEEALRLTQNKPDDLPGWRVVELIREALLGS
jgi:hypothetical protein